MLFVESLAQRVGGRLGDFPVWRAARAVAEESLLLRLDVATGVRNQVERMDGAPAQFQETWPQ